MTASRFFERWVSSRSSSRRCASSSLRFVTSKAERGEPDGRAGHVPQRLDVKIDPLQRDPIELHADLAVLRTADGKRLLLERDDGVAPRVGEDVAVGPADDVFDSATGHGVADRCVAELAVLRVHRHIGLAQRIAGASAVPWS